MPGNSHRGWRTALAATGMVFGALGCSPRPAPGPAAPPAGPPHEVAVRRPSILLISLDTTRADHLGAYGAGQAATPTLDRWARDGVLFEQAMSPVPLTLPAHATLFTGRLPHRHGVRNNGAYRLPDDVPTLAEALQGAGYDTAAVVGAQVLDRQYGLARGFARYDDRTEGGGLAIAERTADKVTDAALLAAGSLREPYFLFVHYFDAHASYAPPSPFKESHATDPYAGEIAFVDSQIARLREGLERAGKLGPSTVVVVTADHGESLGEHGEATHGVFLYQSTLRVPLLVVAPGWKAGTRVPGLVSLADVAPTLAGFAAAPLPAGLDGAPLRPEPAPRRWLPLESDFGLDSYGWAPLRAVTDGRTKWVEAPEAELYDLSADAAEAHNLASDRGQDAAQFRRRWREAVTSDRRALVSQGQATAEDAQRQEGLAALGYVAGSTAAGAGANLPDPKRAIHSLALVNDARALIGRGQFAAAESKLLEARRVGSRNLSALTLLGVARIKAGRPAQAIEPLEAAAQVGPANADVHFDLGLAYVGAGRTEAGLAAWRRTLELSPRYHDAVVNLTDVLTQVGRLDEARRTLAEARQAGLDTPTLRFLGGQLAAASGDRVQARAALRSALAGPLPPEAEQEARRMLRELGD